MPDLDDVLERLVNDAGFRRALEEDPDRALAAYPLTPEERSVLDATVTGSIGTAGHGTMEGRQSKSALIGMLGEVAGVASSAAASGQRGDLFQVAGAVDDSLPDTSGEEAGIIIIGGQPGEDVGFNPQPDPPIAEGRAR